MGTTGAMGMADAVNDGLVGLRLALNWHLTCNHFPALPGEWVDGAIETIEAMADEDFDREITLPESGRYAEQTYSAADLCERMHLWSFLEQEEPDDDDIDYEEDDQ